MYTIAIAEDHDDLRETFCLILQKKGYSVVASAANGQKLLLQLQQLPEPPAACITDLNMPVMDGFTLIEKLKTLYPTVKIMVCSTWDDKGTQQKLMQLGADLFISKRVIADQLIPGLEKLLGITADHSYQMK